MKAQGLTRAKKLGDLLIVGVDSDAKVRARKGPHRPVVPEGERVRILSHLVREVRAEASRVAAKNAVPGAPEEPPSGIPASELTLDDALAMALERHIQAGAP